jgi:VanZ family protein
MALIFYFSGRSDLRRLAGIPGEDFLLHVLEYSVLGFLLAWALSSSGLRKPALSAFLLAVSFGISDELHQHFVPGRSSAMLDVIADGIGTLIGLFVFSTSKIPLWQRRALEKTHPARLSL